MAKLEILKNNQVTHFMGWASFIEVYEMKETCLRRFEHVQQRGNSEPVRKIES